MTKYLRSPNIEAAPLLDETVLYDPEGNRFCVLNATAASLWNRLEAPAEAAELESVLQEAFDGDPETIRSDVQSILEDLKGLGLVLEAE